MYKKIVNTFLLILTLIIFVSGCNSRMVTYNNRLEVEDKIEKTSENIIKIDQSVLPHMKDVFLVSIRKDKKSVFFEEEGADYRTLWVYEKDGEMNVIEIKDKVLVPKDGKFYIIQNDNMELEELLDNSLKTKKKYTNFDYIYKKRFNKLIIDELDEQQKHLYTKDELEKMASDSKWPIENINEKILYVDENYIGIEGKTYSSDNSQNHKDYYVKIFSTVDLNEREELLSKKQLRADRQYKLIKNDLEKQYNKKITDEENNGEIVFSDLDKIEDSYIALIKNEGRLTFGLPMINEKINYNNDTYTITPKEYIPFTVDKSYGVEFDDDVNYTFNRIKNIFPNVKDAVASSTGEVDIVVEENKIYFFEDSKLKEGKAFFSIDLDQDEKMIMATSVSGDEKNIWNETLNEYVKMDIEYSNIKVRSEEIKNKEDGVYDVNIIIPRIELNDKSVEKVINDSLREELQFVEEGLIRIAKIDKNNEGLDFKEYYLKSDYKANVVNDNILSLQVLIKQYVGTEYELEYINSYNFDINTGERLELADIFNEGYGYSEVIKKEILESISKSVDESLYYKDRLKNIEVFERYYLTDTNELVIYFGQNQIASLEEGVCKFFISFDVFGDEIKIK